MHEVSRCSCCRLDIIGPGWTVTTPSGFTDHICRACITHVVLKADGSIYRPRPCTDEPPRLRVLRRLDSLTRSTISQEYGMLGM